MSRLVDAFGNEFGDSRIADSFGRFQVPGPGGAFVDKVFCVSCHRESESFSLPDSTHLAYLCQDCFDKHGGLPLPRITDEQLEVMAKARR